jgi:type I restriction-modification system DNA methylase subunit
LKVIVCIRNPLEVARSLFLRGDASEPSQFQLWLTYYRRLLSSTSAEQRLVTHYQSYFQSAPAELQRVLDWLGAEAADATLVTDATLAKACAHASAELRHHYVTTAELFEARVPDEVLGLYLNLCAEAGPVYRQARNNETLDDQSRAFVHDNEVRELWAELQQVRAAAAAREQTLNEILNSKSFKLASWFWRRRGRK